MLALRVGLLVRRGEGRMFGCFYIILFCSLHASKWFYLYIYRHAFQLIINSLSTSAQVSQKDGTRRLEPWR